MAKASNCTAATTATKGLRQVPPVRLGAAGIVIPPSVMRSSMAIAAVVAHGENPAAMQHPSALASASGSGRPRIMYSEDPAMPFFRRPDYQSDTTQFINQLRTIRPELAAEQRKGRGLLWDKSVDRNLWREYRESTVPQKPYVYQTDNRQG